ncbi:MAG: DUF1269 domain-containing protein [Chloroflexi bacterium]|nr:DUF1269 domain-containing protein [Chloroflexota bacterium]MBK7175945.1 DUF1269 domain-containing protein [Chloroflexota bacterium]MBK8934500.1 DUF1269 domain-containing protein [Chloroflexota bacterium]MBP6803421.1 DUF1269 domain-containing protein [Chloroflexota bacterium]MBP7590083.1 DUF1269 domain-containing protein [Chloroflexota bacterium]
MSDPTIELIIAAFNAEDAADEALKELKAAKKEKLIGIEAAAVIRRDKKNKLHVKEVGELTTGKGAVGGVVLGAALGLLTGGTGLILGAAGAAIGGLIGKKQDIGFPNERLQQIGESLKPETSAIVAVIEHKWVAQLEDELAELGAEVMTAAIAADIAEQLDAGKDVAYSALSSAEGLSASRTAVGENEIEMSNITATAEGVVVSAGVVNEAGMAASVMAIDEDTAVLGTIVALNDPNASSETDEETDA